MIVATHCLPVRRQQEKGKQQHPGEDTAELFQAMLGDMPLSPLHSGAPLQHCLDPSVSPIQTSGSPIQIGPLREYESTRELSSLPETLQLRAVGGPLAGLMINAGWQGGRLVLRMIVPSVNAAQHLSKRGKALEDALSALLEISVTVEIDHDD